MVTRKEKSNIEAGWEKAVTKPCDGLLRLHFSFGQKTFLYCGTPFYAWLFCYRSKETKNQRNVVSKLVFWTQSTTEDYIRAKTNFNLSPISSSHKSSNHTHTHTHTQIFKNPQKLSWHKFTYNKTYTNTKHIMFEELVPSVLPLLKKHIRLGHAGIVHHSVHLSIPDFFLKYKKWMDRSNK